jgi:hypothetical protein
MCMELQKYRDSFSFIDDYLEEIIGSRLKAMD